jgi:hypothetical protein
MSEWQVTLVTAFGRGESLALALAEKGFAVRIVDFSKSLPEYLSRGSGPFPLALPGGALANLLPEHGHIQEFAKSLPRGLSFWMERGPIELDGPMAGFYLQSRRDVQVWKNDARTDVFEDVWLKNFLAQWASPLWSQSWESAGSGRFPASERLGLLSHTQEARVIGFERAKALDIDYREGADLDDVETDGKKLMRVLSGQAFTSSRWIWCLSSYETYLLNETAAAQVFPRGVRRPDWCWMSLEGHVQRGPWVEGLPDYSIVIGDVCLPWVYGNVAVMRRLETGHFRVWVKVPFARAQERESRQLWADEVLSILNRRLPQAGWKVDADKWRICPHSWIFERPIEKGMLTHWKNWNWLAPESLDRLDFAARFSAEAGTFQKLVEWRAEQIKKNQGANRDRALHAP